MGENQGTGFFLTRRFHRLPLGCRGYQILFTLGSQGGKSWGPPPDIPCHHPPPLQGTLVLLGTSPTWVEWPIVQIANLIPGKYIIHQFALIGRCDTAIDKWTG